MPVADLSNPIVPEFDVIINGRPLVDTARPFIGSIVVDDSIAWPSMFALQFTGSFELLDDVHTVDRLLRVCSWQRRGNQAGLWKRDGKSDHRRDHGIGA